MTTVVSSPSDVCQVENFLRTQILKGTVVECEVPSSRSFLYIVSAPFLLAGEWKLSPELAAHAISASTFAAHAHLTTAPHVIHDSQCSDSCTI